MRIARAVAGATVAVIGTVLLAPSAWAMVPLPEPGSGGAGSSTWTITGSAIWLVLSIVLVAVAIGAVGIYLAQRTHREADTRSVSVA